MGTRLATKVMTGHRTGSIATYKEQNISAVVAALDRGVLVPYSFPEVDIVVSSRCVLDWFIAHHGILL